jgi:hypothetical protein
MAKDTFLWKKNQHIQENMDQNMQVIKPSEPPNLHVSEQSDFPWTDAKYDFLEFMRSGN